MTPSNAGIWVSAAYAGDPDGNNTLNIYWKRSIDASWPETPQFALGHAASPYNQKISSLSNGTAYDLRIEFIDPGGVSGANPRQFDRIIPSLLIHNSDNATLQTVKWGTDGWLRFQLPRYFWYKFLNYPPLPVFICG